MTGNNDDQQLEFYPRARSVLFAAGLMLVLFVAWGVMSFSEGMVRAMFIMTLGGFTAAAFASPYLLRKEPTLTLAAEGVTLRPTFSRRVFIPWHCLISARTAIRVKHHLRLEVDWTRLRAGDADPTGVSLPSERSAPLELHGLRRIDLDGNVHDVILLLQTFKDRYFVEAPTAEAPELQAPNLEAPNAEADD